VIYMRERPNPRPAVFGFHELFHVLVIAAALAHFIAIAGFVVPRG
jgi:hemolysin III